MAGRTYTKQGVGPGEIAAWQATYRDALRRRFGFSRASLTKGIVIQALELANMWMNDTGMPLAAIQASIITGVLAKAPDH